MLSCIVNPSSRSGKDASIKEELFTQLEEKGIPYKEYETDGPGAAMRMAREFTSDEAYNGEPVKLVVLGGDGTLNEVVSGITDLSRVLLGYLPTGSSNDFARGALLSRDHRVLIDSIVSGECKRRIDVGRLIYHQQTKTLSRLHDQEIETERRFLVSAGIGFDAAVCEEALSSGTKNFFNRIGLGKLTYGTIALRNLLNADRIGLTLTTAEGEECKLDHFVFAAAMQLPYEGGGFMFAPDADNTDGKFNICVAGDMSKPRMLLALPFAYFGRHYGIPGIYHYRTASLRIRTELPMWVHTDGEVMMKSGDIELECLPGALALMV